MFVETMVILDQAEFLKYNRNLSNHAKKLEMCRTLEEDYQTPKFFQAFWHSNRNDIQIAKFVN